MTYWAPTDLYLAHHGIKGQKWGIRRYQNPDGSLTALGKKRYEIYNSQYKEDLERYTASHKGEKNIFPEFYEKKKAEFTQKLGEERINEINEKVNDTVFQLDNSDFSKFKTNSKNKKLWDEYYPKLLKMHGTPEELSETYKKVDKFVTDVYRKLAREYTQTTLDQILKSVPKDLQDDAYDYVTNYWWDYWVQP